MEGDGDYIFLSKGELRVTLADLLKKQDEHFKKLGRGIFFYTSRGMANVFDIERPTNIDGVE